MNEKMRNNERTIVSHKDHRWPLWLEVRYRGMTLNKEIDKKGELLLNLTDVQSTICGKWSE